MERSKVRGMRMPATSAQPDRQQDEFKERVERQTAAFRAAIDFFRIDTPAEPRGAPAPEGRQGLVPPMPRR
jgi:hypothetical protein